LLVMQSLWGMSRLGPGEDPPVEAQIARLHAVGFDGAGVRCMERGFVARAAAELRARGLAWQAQCLPRAPGDLAPMLDLAAEFGAAQANVLAYLPPAPPNAHAAIIARWREEAASRGVAMLVETHRATATNGMEETAALLDALPGLRLTADLSHHVVGRGVKIPVAPEIAPMLARILARSDALHLRIGTSEQVQVPPLWPSSAPWLATFSGWWREVFRHRLAARAPAEVVALVELGPPPFALTGADGAELSDRWTDALALRDRIRAVWEEARETTG
jgi:hypothetical protein